MKILVITGDKNFGPGHERYELQRSAADMFTVVHWGRGSLWPRIPAGSFDVVTSQDPFWRGLFGWCVARYLRAEFNVQVHSDINAQSLIKHILAQVVLRHADSIRVVSQRIKEQVERIGAAAPITVLPVYIDVERFRAVERHPDGKTVLWIGRFEREKNPFSAIEVVQGIPGVKLVMLGKGSLEAELKRQAEGLPIEFPGWQDPADYLSRADVVLCTSPAESFGVSIVEALAAGVPVVAPDVGVAKEAGAIIVPRERLAEAVVDALKNPRQGALKLNLLPKDEWVRAWLASF